jgi:hypothetical protein
MEGMQASSGQEMDFLRWRGGGALGGRDGLRCWAGERNEKGNKEDTWMRMPGRGKVIGGWGPLCPYMWTWCDIDP